MTDRDLRIEEEVHAIANSLSHWQAIIQWVKRQPSDSLVDFYWMRDSSGMGIGSKHCPLCTYTKKRHNYDNEYLSIPEEWCQVTCPLGRQAGRCCYQKGSPYRIVYDSDTWEEFVRNAEKYMIPALRKLSPVQAASQKLSTTRSLLWVYLPHLSRICTEDGQCVLQLNLSPTSNIEREYETIIHLVYAHNEGLLRRAYPV